MRIKAIRCLLFSAPYGHEGDAERARHLRSGYRSASIIQITTDIGLYGLGEAYAGSYAPEVVRAITEQMAEVLEGASPLDIADCMRRVQHAIRYWGRTGLPQGVTGALEMALLDIKGKAYGVPAYELLGGRMHETLPVYASGGNDKPEADLRDEMRLYVEGGYRAVKVRINNLSTAEILKKVQICHESLGGRATLALDAVQSNVPTPWTLKQAKQHAILLEPFNPLWLEEPLPPEDLDGLARLCSSTTVPIAGGETVTTTAEARQYFEHRSLDIFQPDTSVLGGLTRFLEIACLAAADGVELAVHSWCSGVGHMANYHAAFATKNRSFLELSNVRNPLREAFLMEPWQLLNGELKLAATPGLGVHLPDGLQEEYAYLPGSHYKFSAG